MKELKIMLGNSIAYDDGSESDEFVIEVEFYSATVPVNPKTLTMSDLYRLVESKKLQRVEVDYEVKTHLQSKNLHGHNVFNLPGDNSEHEMSIVIKNEPNVGVLFSYIRTHYVDRDTGKPDKEKYYGVWDWVAIKEEAGAHLTVLSTEIKREEIDLEGVERNISDMVRRMREFAQVISQIRPNELFKQSTEIKELGAYLDEKRGDLSRTFEMIERIVNNFKNNCLSKAQENSVLIGKLQHGMPQTVAIAKDNLMFITRVNNLYHVFSTTIVLHKNQVRRFLAIIKRMIRNGAKEFSEIKSTIIGKEQLLNAASVLDNDIKEVESELISLSKLAKKIEDELEQYDRAMAA